jgi:hypothetical protein
MEIYTLVKKTTRPLLYALGVQHPHKLFIRHVGSEFLLKRQGMYRNLVVWLNLNILLTLAATATQVDSSIFYRCIISLNIEKRSIQNLNRPLLYVERDYVEYFNQYLVRWVHYVPVLKNLSDLIEKVNWVKNHEVSVLKIAQNAFDFAQDNFNQSMILSRIYQVYKKIKEKREAV